MAPRIGIAMGDVTGVGPEVTLKALSAELSRDATTYLLLGDEGVVQRTLGLLGLQMEIAPHQTAHSARVTFLNPTSGHLPSTLTPGSAEAAQLAMACLVEGAKRCLDGELCALVTAPVNKEAIIDAGHPGFVGQTEFLSDLAGAKRTAMMLLGSDAAGHWLRVALVTTHLPLRRVADSITGPKVELAIELAARACADLGLPRAKVGVCGLNPHAGEGGKMGDEEITTIAPAVRAACGRGFDVVGPVSADTLFYQAYNGGFDAVVAMYHDQGLAPLKMIGFETGINWTLGLPFIRTSPDHGTAYDIAGRGIANAGSMISALRLARQLAGRRAPDGQARVLAGAIS